MALPKTTQDRIEQEAAHYVDQAHAYIGDDIHQAYIAGATSYAERAQKLVEALEIAKREIVALYKKQGYKESFVTRTIDESLVEWKGAGKEVDRPCPHCGKELSRDRNLCCRECGKEVEG